MLKTTPKFLGFYFAAFSLAYTQLIAASDEVHFASGVKVGEVHQTSAIVWTRLTKGAKADYEALPILSEGLESKEASAVRMPANVVVGAAGEVRLRCVATGQAEVLTKWSTVGAETDFTHQFELSGLQSDTAYEFTVEGRSGSSGSVTQQAGKFRTAPDSRASKRVRFIVSTCQAIRSIDSGTDGHQAYNKMLAFEPHFFVHTGDIVYYDKAPFAKNLAEARAKWHLIFSYGYQREFFRQVPAYFMKDDHDTLKNDCWPGQTYGDLTFDEGLAIFREQTPMGQLTYRTARWGKHVQVWMTENRDYRSPNNAPDGPEKSILGEVQKRLLKEQLKQSDATYKFVISPGPLVGPDKKGKKDNHANEVFAREGAELRDYLSAIPRTFVICGDRHWQYCSQDPKTGLLEMGCGPINDEHDFGGDPGEDPAYHRYFGSRGGFLGITVDGEQATAEWFSASDPADDQGRPKVLHMEDLSKIE